MLVIVLENASPRLRGRLALWLLEVRAGVYVGRIPAKLRDRIWQEVVENIASGNAVLIERARTEAGFAFATCGSNRRRPANFDGFPLVEFETLETAEPFVE